MTDKQTDKLRFFSWRAMSDLPPLFYYQIQADPFKLNNNIFVF